MSAGRCAILALCWALTAQATRALAQAPPAALKAAHTARFALVIGNNRPETPDRVTLRYADDDAVATYELLKDAGVASTLLVSPDADTRAQNGSTAYTPATIANVERSAREIQAQVKQAAARGEWTEFFLFFSGHGDEDDSGEGYVTLEHGQRLRRGQLIALLEKIGAHRNHVVVDACKSGALLFERGANGTSEPYTGEPLALSARGQLPNTGFVLSATSTGESHEWERYRAGILSHELRSALRGAADVDGDGAISYEEVRGFLGRANESVLPNFRPRFTIVPPGHGDIKQRLLVWQRQPSLELSGTDLGHIYVETLRGRIADLYPEPGRITRLWTPAEQQLFVKRDDETLEYTVTLRDGMLRVDTVGARAPAMVARGAHSEAYKDLFAAPFVAADLVRFAELSRQPQTSQSTRSERTGAWIAGGSTVVFGASALAFGLVAQAKWNANDRLAETCNGCEQLVRERQSAVRTYQTLTNVSLALMAVAAATTVTLFFLEPALSRPTAEVAVGLGSVEIAGRF